jgi:hypothetical protein
MNVLRAILAELWGLFVDDGLLAIGLVLWVAVAALLVPAFGLRAIGGPLLFLGAAAVLVASLLKAGGKRF